MQTLATGVGDLKKVLSNVKTRGVFGEIQLSVILEDIIPGEFYVKNAQVKAGSDERVEYAIKLPRKGTNDNSLLLPIDSKFPIEDFHRLLEGLENSLQQEELKRLYKNFEDSIKFNAKKIKEKYINPPTTTDFALMFVPTESLYSEILRREGLFRYIQNEYKVTIVGPTNLDALLNSLLMGFKTLEIEKRSSEVWEILGAVKTQFGSFGEILAKTKKKLIEATNVMESAEQKTRAIERRLKNVQSVEGSVIEKGEVMYLTAEEEG
jgi:DNA recombination protein RmuC